MFLTAGPPPRPPGILMSAADPELRAGNIEFTAATKASKVATLTICQQKDLTGKTLLSEMVFGERKNFLFNSLVETFNLSIGAVLDELALA